MTNLPRTPTSAIFWDFAKGGPRENAQKSRPTIRASKRPCPKSIISLSLSALRALMEAQFAAKCSSMIALQVHTNQEIMRFAPGCFWSPYRWRTFLSIFPWSPLGKISENGRFRSPWQISHNLALGALMEAQFEAKCSSMIALQAHSNYEMMRFALGCFWSPYSRPTFLSIFYWSPLCKISENGRFRSPWQICHNSALRALMEAQVAAKCSSMIAL